MLLTISRLTHNKNLHSPSINQIQSPSTPCLSIPSLKRLNFTLSFVNLNNQHKELIDIINIMNSHDTPPGKGHLHEIVLPLDP